VLLLVAAVAVALAIAGGPDDARGAQPLLLRNATSEFDRFLTDPPASRKRWIRRNYFQIRGYSRFFEDVAMPWRPPPAQFYKDLYAIYTSSQSGLISRHPDWVLRDLLGQPLFIPYECRGVRCPQYAADIGNPRWRAHWIAQARRIFERSRRKDPRGHGYAGIFIDDVNLELRTSYGNGRAAVPFDPRTGTLMDEQAWQVYMAGFVEQVRAALPRVKIMHNSLWWLPHSDPEVRRQNRAADWIELERGFNDSGIVAGSGTYGYETFLAHIAWLQRNGNRVLLGPDLESVDQARYELANYFLVRQGRDAIESDFRTDPPTRGRSDFWPGWRVNPGRATGAAGPLATGLWRRDFTRGTAIVSPPGGPTATVAFERPHTNLEGETARSFELEPRSGDVYVVAVGSGPSR
jgi:hypothetical protein